MAVTRVLRDQFIDRALDIAELAELIEMVRRWYLSAFRDEDAQLVLEATAYAFPRQTASAIHESLKLKLPLATFDLTDPDEVRVVAAPASPSASADVSVWREVLAEPSLAHACVLLKLTIRGLMSGNAIGTLGQGESKFVLCGAPANGAMLVKAIWLHRNRSPFSAVYRNVRWEKETDFLDALEVYLANRSEVGADVAVAWAQNRFGKGHLFLSARLEKSATWLIRHRMEMPDDRGPAAFLRRVAIPLIAAICALFLAWLTLAIPVLTILCFAVAAYMFFSVCRIIWTKFAKVRRLYVNRRKLFDQLFSRPFEPVVADCSQDKSPTLLKYSAEIEALGAQLVCDATVKRGVVKDASQRIYRLADSTFALGLLRQTEHLLYFPPQPVLSLSTWFTDGRRHFTTSNPRYRKLFWPQITARCLLNGGGPAEIWALHRREVDKLIAAGAVPIDPPATADEVFKRQQEQHEENRITWEKSPYSWTDAIHDAFKICRREFLPDR